MKFSVAPDWSGSVDTPGEEFCPLCVGASKDNGETGVVDPPSFPIYLRLHCREPWVPEDGLVFAKVGEEELECDGGRPGSDV